MVPNLTRKSKALLSCHSKKPSYEQGRCNKERASKQAVPPIVQRNRKELKLAFWGGTEKGSNSVSSLSRTLQKDRSESEAVLESSCFCLTSPRSSELHFADEVKLLPIFRMFAQSGANSANSAK